MTVTETVEEGMFQTENPIHELNRMLVRYDLTPNQSKVYLFLSKIGIKTASEISKALKIPRTETYHLLSTLQQKGISCRVLDMFSVKPIDDDLLEKAARETGCIVTSEEHNIFGGMGSAVAESVSERYPVPIKRIGAQDMFGESARDNEISLLLEKHGITSFNMVKQVKEIRSKKV